VQVLTLTIILIVVVILVESGLLDGILR
jgi:hypothetical protein